MKEVITRQTQSLGVGNRFQEETTWKILEIEG